jgi:hypothetical protein
VHGVRRIVVENYRSCIRFEGDLSDFTAFVGYNNAGKSNVLGAVRWAIKGGGLATTDFNDPARPASVEFLVDGITAELLDGLVETHRRRIAPFCVGGALRLRRVQASPGGGVKAAVLEVRRADGDWQTNPAGIPEALAALLPDPIEIRAMEDAGEDVSKWKSGTTIGRLLGELAKPVDKAYGDLLTKALGEFGRRLGAEGTDRAPELEAVDEAANDALRDLFPDLRIKVHIPAPELKEVFKAGTIKVYEGTAEAGRDVSAVGHGAQRSIQMALVRVLAERGRSEGEAASRTLLLVDEPELYLHPQGVEQTREALKTLSRGQYQVLASTHSPLMIAPEDAETAILVHKPAGKGTRARTRLVDAVREALEAGTAQKELLFELSRLAEVLFSERILFVEGKTEQRLLPELFARVTGRTLRGARIGFVPLGSSGGIPGAMRILQAMGLDVRAVVDLDFPFKVAPAVNLVPPDDARVDAVRARSRACAPSAGFRVSDDGFPCKGGSLSAEKAWELLADDEEVRRNVEALHSDLQKRGIWFWRGGAMEAVLGIEGKKSSTHAGFLERLSRGSVSECVADATSLEACLRWISDPWADAEF